MDTKTLKEAIRQPYAWPGGYQLYLLMSDGEALCMKCARSEFRALLEAMRDNDNSGWRPEAVDIYWEGPPMNCAHCGREMVSEYGDPAEEGDNRKIRSE